MDTQVFDGGMNAICAEFFRVYLDEGFRRWRFILSIKLHTL